MRLNFENQHIYSKYDYNKYKSSIKGKNIMSLLNAIWLILNILLILLILIRNPNEQSLQETLGSLNLFDSSGSAERNLDKLIQIFTITYFVIGFLLSSKAFS